MSSEKTVIDKLVSENEKQRQELQELLREKEEMNRVVRKLEGEIKSI